MSEATPSIKSTPKGHTVNVLTCHACTQTKPVNVFATPDMCTDCFTQPSKDVQAAFNAGFHAAFTKVTPELRCLEVMTIRSDSWMAFAQALQEDATHRMGFDHELLTTDKQ